MFGFHAFLSKNISPFCFHIRIKCITKAKLHKTFIKQLESKFLVLLAFLSTIKHKNTRECYITRDKSLTDKSFLQQRLGMIKLIIVRMSQTMYFKGFSYSSRWFLASTGNFHATKNCKQAKVWDFFFPITMFLFAEYIKLYTYADKVKLQMNQSLLKLNDINLLLILSLKQVS